MVNLTLERFFILSRKSESIVFAPRFTSEIPLETLRKALKNKDSYIREDAVDAIGTLKEGGNIELLKGVLLTDEDEYVRECAADALLEQRSKVRNIKNELVFFNLKGGKINGYTLCRTFKNITEESGIKDFKFHDLRHSFATRLAQNGVDIYKIAKLLNHKDLKMTQRYSHHCPDSLRDGVEVLKKFDYNLIIIWKKCFSELKLSL